MTMNTDAAPQAEETFLESPTEEYVEMPELIEVERQLSFTDGFQFGCGFWLAGLVALTLFMLGALLLNFFFSILGMPLFG
ncbi:MAG: hypothetical protein GXP42_07995 [Chloroflexi bacterium]|nr:hypothetical protein [Chloroflexota bacterium]